MAADRFWLVFKSCHQVLETHDWVDGGHVFEFIQYGCKLSLTNLRKVNILKQVYTFYCTTAIEAISDNYKIMYVIMLKLSVTVPQVERRQKINELT